MTTSLPLLQLQSISHAFSGLKILRDLDMDIPQGKITCLVGPNGAGKSTLFNIISGFLIPDSGTVMFDGQDVTRWDVTRRSRSGLVRTFQTPQVFARMTVRENLMAAAAVERKSSFVASLFYTPRARADVKEMARVAQAVSETLGLASIADRVTGSLPAGQQRMVELARAWVTSPKLLCLDEPSSGLNPEEIEGLRAALHRILNEGTSILLVSHDMDLVKIGSWIHVLCFGEIITSGVFGDITANPKVREAYLGI